MLWTQSQPVIAAYIACHVRDGSVADDLVQETAMALLRNFDRYDQQRDFTAWAIGTARNQLLQFWRKYKRTRESPFCPELMDRIAHLMSEQSDHLIERQRALRQCIEQLDRKASALVQKRFVAQASVKTIAEQYEVSEGTVGSWLSRLRKKLSYCIDQRLAHGEAG